MLVYQDLLSEDELLADSYPHTEILNGMLWEVEGKWVGAGAGANPSLEGVEDELGLEDPITPVNFVDIVGAFRLQKLPPFTKSQFRVHMKTYASKLYRKLDEEKQQILKNNFEAVTNHLLAKLSDLEIYVGESMHEDSLPVFAYNKDGAANPTFVYLAVALKEFEAEISRPKKEVEAPAAAPADDQFPSWARLHFLYL